ncbi:MAG: Rhomboid family protein [bacterium ADurb.Bin478]|nr:MAG: Rhomboid family protein [bacterium ADurb.Bin478]
MSNNEYRMTRAGWICAAGVMALFGLQQIFPLRELMLLSGRSGAAAKAVHALTCMFVHGSLLHAAVNALAFICLFYGLRREFSGAVLLVGFAAGWASTALFACFLMPQYATLVGSSGIIYGVFGVFTSAEPFSRWRFCGIGSIPLIVLAPVLVAADGVISMLFVKCSAWPVHTVSFALGAGLVALLRCVAAKQDPAKG